MSEYTFRGTHTILQRTQTAWSEESILRPEPWTKRAACQEVDPEIFFDDRRGRPLSYRDAITTCLGCPVRALCLQYALDRNEKYGVWGGLTPHQRARLTNGRADPRYQHGKLNPTAAREIRERTREGESRAALAAEYGVKAAHIGRIIRGDAW